MEMHERPLNAYLPSGKAACCMIPAVWHSGKGKTTETVQRSAVAGGWGGDGVEQQIFRAVNYSL